jgi:hypothetical protein
VQSWKLTIALIRFFCFRQFIDRRPQKNRLINSKVIYYLKGYLVGAQTYKTMIRSSYSWDQFLTFAIGLKTFIFVWSFQLRQFLSTWFLKHDQLEKTCFWLLLFSSKHQMGCPALGIWVAFLKQHDALPGRAPQKNKSYIFLNYIWFICDFLLMIFIFLNYFWRIFLGGCFTRQCGLFQKTDPNSQCWTSHLGQKSNTFFGPKFWNFAPSMQNRNSLTPPHILCVLEKGNATKA